MASYSDNVLIIAEEDQFHAVIKTFKARLEAASIALNDDQGTTAIGAALGVSGQTIFNHLKVVPVFVAVRDGIGRGKPKLFSLTREAKEKLQQNPDALALLSEYA